MAYINITHGTALTDRIREMLERVREVRAKRALYNRTVAELNALSDRDLSDLGISRLNIEDISWAHVYGA